MKTLNQYIEDQLQDDKVYDHLIIALSLWAVTAHHGIKHPQSKGLINLLTSETVRNMLKALHFDLSRPWTTKQQLVELAKNELRKEFQSEVEKLQRENEVLLSRIRECNRSLDEAKAMLEEYENKPSILRLFK